MPRRPPPRKQRRGQRDLTVPWREYRWEVGVPCPGTRLDAFLAARVSWRSRAGVQRLVAEGAVEVLPGKDPQQAPVGTVRDGLKLRVGQEVVLRVPEPGAPAPGGGEGDGVGPCGRRPELAVLYEDEHILVVDKPAHVSVHPSRGHLRDSLIHRIHEWQRARNPELREVATLCHRLDRETSGVVLAAKDRLSRTRLGRQFERREVEKTYLAVVVGEMAGEEGVVDLPLGPALTSRVRLKMAVRHDRDAQPAETRWRVRCRAAGRTLVELRPKTGRQHQLRVHMAALGHPIVGDKLYQGGEEVFLRHVEGELTEEDRRLLVLDRQALHAWRLAFEHPFTGRRLEVEAPLPADMAALVGGCA